MSYKALPEFIFTPASLDEFCNEMRELLSHIAVVPRNPDDIGWLRSNAPDLIVVLLRSAAPAFRTFQRIMQRRNVPLPPVCFAHIGSEMWARFGDPVASYAVPRYDHPDAETIKQLTQRYAIWLSEDDYARAIVAQLRGACFALPKHCKALGLCIASGNVLGIVTDNAPPDNAPSPLLIATAPPLQCAMSSPALPTRRVLHFQCSSLHIAPSPPVALHLQRPHHAPLHRLPAWVTCSPPLVATFAHVVRATPYSANALRSRASKRRLACDCNLVCLRQISFPFQLVPLFWEVVLHTLK